MIDPAVFAEHVGSDFSVNAPGGPVPLRLIEVADGGVSRGIRQFSLFFHGPGARLLPQEVHTFEHPVLGMHEIFVVPVQGSTAERILYQACFNVPA